MSDKIEVRFFLNDSPHASRVMTHIPRKGEEIRLSTGLYEITSVVWIQDGPQPHVAMDMKVIIDRPFKRESDPQGAERL